MAIQGGRVAPGTAYTTGNDAVSVTPKRDSTHVLTVSVDTGTVQMLKRVNGVDLNLGQVLDANTEYTFEFGSDDQTPYSIRFDTNCTILELHIIERRGT